MNEVDLKCNNDENGSNALIFKKKNAYLIIIKKYSNMYALAIIKIVLFLTFKTYGS